jgi:hypothetical protein
MRLFYAIGSGLSFLVVLISVYFGSNIYRANENRFITHLNEMDRISYFGLDQVPQLSYNAALFTLPLLLFILVVEIIILFKKPNIRARNIAIGALVAICIIMVFSVLTLRNPVGYDFSHWGYIWITLGLVVFAGNVLSIFLKPEFRN